MQNYLPKQSYITQNFSLSLYPYVAAPANRFEAGIALQYGADFRVLFGREGNQQSKIGLIQLTCPQTAIFQHTVVKAWNVDKVAANSHPITMGRCLYANDHQLVGVYSTYYQAQHRRLVSENMCSLIDTPREFNSEFKDGIFTGTTSTKFANYVVELSNKNGVIFDLGIVWGYSYAQNSANPGKFEAVVLKPQKVRLSEASVHLTAIANFLGISKNEVKSYIQAR